MYIRFVVFSTVISGAVEHGNHYTLKLMYEHILERTAYNMTYGPFGGVKSKCLSQLLAICNKVSWAKISYFPSALAHVTSVSVAQSTLTWSWHCDDFC